MRVLSQQAPGRQLLNYTHYIKKLLEIENWQMRVM